MKIEHKDMFRRALKRACHSYLMGSTMRWVGPGDVLRPMEISSYEDPKTGWSAIVRNNTNHVCLLPAFGHTSKDWESMKQRGYLTVAGP